MHHGVGQVILHHGIVLDHIVQTQLVQAIVTLGGIVLIEFDLKAIALGTHGRNIHQGSVALTTDAHIVDGFAVDHHITHGVNLTLSGGQEAIPVIHDDVNGMHLGVIEQFFLVTHDRCGHFDTQSFAIHKQDRDQQGNHHCQHTDPVHAFPRTHGN